MNKKNILYFVLMICVGVGIFYAGVYFEKSKNPQRGNFTGQPNTGSGMRMGKSSGLGNFISGEIISMDEKSITLKLQNGGSKIVLLNKDTKVSKMADGELKDLLKGINISVSGSLNGDSSLTADSIQIRPTMPQNVRVN